MKWMLPCVVLLGLAACVSSDEFKKSPREAAEYNAQLGIVYLQQGKLDAAREKFERAVQQDSQNLKAQIGAGVLYQKLGENEKADRHYSAALRLKPDDPEVLNNYGQFLCGQKRTEEGEKLFLKAVRNPLYRTPETAYNNAGFCLQDAGKTAEAQVYFDKARALRSAKTPAR